MCIGEGQVQAGLLRRGLGVCCSGGGVGASARISLMEGVLPSRLWQPERSWSRRDAAKACMAACVSPKLSSNFLANLPSTSAIPWVISSRNMARNTAMVAALISTLVKGSSASKACGTISASCIFARAWLSRSGVPSGADLFVDAGIA